ncbi:TRAFAC clade GTPase domain-containing protein [Massilia sp. SYSU DXS3249]
MDIGFLAGKTRTRLIGLFGAAESGKTSLLGAWYLLLGRDISPDGTSFAGSLTLEGWENIAGSLRWNAMRGPAFPPHTSSGTGRHPGLLHLDLQVHEVRKDILFADAPGEWFSRWSVRRDAEEATGALWLSEASDVLIVVADSDALAGPRMGAARTNLVALLRRVGAERRGRPVALVWTKCDVKVDDQMRQAVIQAADLTLGSYRAFSVSMHSAPGQEAHNRGQGLIELLDWALSVPETPFLKLAEQEPEQELLRQVGGVHA